jgi:type I restriction enzyme M protein
MSQDRITMSEIARHVGVTLQAVSNWRRRHPTFPSADNADGVERFDIDAVSEWLDGRRISKNDLASGELPGSTYGARFRNAMSTRPVTGVEISNELWAQLDSLRGAEDVATFADLLLGLLYVALTDDDHWSNISAAEDAHRRFVEMLKVNSPLLDNFYRAHRNGIVHTGPVAVRLAEAIRLIEQVRQSRRGTEVFEFLLDNFAAVEGRRGASMHTPSAVIQLVVELTVPTRGASVFDPCCGSGGFLVGAAKYLLTHGGRTAATSFTGHALSERSATLAAMNLRLRGVSADVDTRVDSAWWSDDPPQETRRFDVIMSNPPFDWKGPADDRSGLQPRVKSSFAYLRYAARSLANDGRAAVVMPGSALFREGPEEQIRARMIDDGIVEAIVGLPPGMFAATGIPVNVWLLRKSTTGRENDILLIDASDLGQLVNRTQRALSQDDQRRIVNAAMRWRAGDGHQDVRGFSASVSRQRIRDEDYVLTPARYVGRSASSNTPQPSVSELLGDLDQLHWRAAESDAAADRRLDRIRAWIR